MKETRRIRVIGCMNCPYCDEFVNECLPLNEQRLEMKCTHPSFKRHIHIDQSFKVGFRPDVGFIPDWCPLEMESFMCSSN